MSSQYRDAWRQREAWRSHPVFSTRSYIRNFAPGFGIAVVAFSAYVFVDTMLHPANMDYIKQKAKDEQEGKTVLGTLKKLRSGEQVTPAASRGDFKEE